MKTKKIVEFMLPIAQIQPTQLFISKVKYNGINIDNNEYDAIAVKTVGKEVFFVGNHEIPLYLANNGKSQIKVYENDDPSIDMMACFTKVKWCHDKKIKTIKDLSIYMVDEKEYKKKWIKVCDKLNTQLYKTPLFDVSFVKEIIPERKSNTCHAILKALPSWFAIEKAIDHYCESAKKMEFIKVLVADKVVGFLAYQINYGINCDLYVLGIYEPFHRYGIGSLLVEHLNSEIKLLDVKYMSVKTLSENHHDEGYMMTRNFYIKNGFYPFEELSELWGKENPCLLMIREVK